MSSFDIKSFLNDSFEPRVKKVTFKPLKKYGQAKISIRSLTGVELAQCLDAKNAFDRLEKVAVQLASGMDDEKVEAVKDLFAIDSDFPFELAKRIQVVIFGVQEPELSRDVVVKLAKHFPVDLWGLANEILNLTDQGSVVKPKPSGETRKSEAA